MQKCTGTLKQAHVLYLKTYLHVAHNSTVFPRNSFLTLQNLIPFYFHLFTNLIYCIKLNQLAIVNQLRLTIITAGFTEPHVCNTWNRAADACMQGQICLLN